jgi:hypothetical protein
MCIVSGKECWQQPVAVLQQCCRQLFWCIISLSTNSPLNPYPLSGLLLLLPLLLSMQLSLLAERG